MTYTRENPSPRYLELVAQYRKMHAEGDKRSGLQPQDLYYGMKTLSFAKDIKELVQETKAKTLLDYGSGKGGYYKGNLYSGIHSEHPLIQQCGSLEDYWGIEHVTCFDPGFAPFSAYPNGVWDGVICIDVLEHCPEEDVSWIIDDLFLFAQKFLFANIALYPAGKFLPSGENAHCTVKPFEWWESLFRRSAENASSVKWKVIFENFQEGELRRVKEVGKGI